MYLKIKKFKGPKTDHFTQHKLKSKGILMGTLGFPVLHKLKSKGILMGTLGFPVLHMLK